MATRRVECLSCGATRRILRGPSRPLQAEDCSRCGYLGWAETATLTETIRRLLRDTALDQRRVSTVAW